MVQVDIVTSHQPPRDELFCDDSIIHFPHFEFSSHTGSHGHSLIVYFYSNFAYNFKFIVIYVWL